jgi:hypothetical protein
MQSGKRTPREGGEPLGTIAEAPGVGSPLVSELFICRGEQAANVFHIVRLVGDELDRYRASGGLSLRHKRS